VRSNGRHATGADAKAQLLTLIEATRADTLTAQELVLDALRGAILTGVIEPGARLRQEELADLFGTSRIPVREALRALEYEGLVSSEPHRGFMVTSLDADDIDEVYELRILLEGEAVRLAIPLMTDEDVADLDALFQEMQAASGPDAQLAARELFYTRLYSISGRPRLVGLITRLRQEVARALRWSTIQHSAAVHESFWEAIREGDADRAVAHLDGHYRRVASLIRRHIREGRGQRGPAGRVLTASGARPAAHRS
jgi:DNA-binding GntR family transcriptional regulator